MSKPIRSYPQQDQAKVIARRIKGDAKGLGTVSAIAAQKRLDSKRNQ